MRRLISSVLGLLLFFSATYANRHWSHHQPLCFRLSIVTWGMSLLECDEVWRLQSPSLSWKVTMNCSSISIVLLPLTCVNWNCLNAWKMEPAATSKEKKEHDDGSTSNRIVFCVSLWSLLSTIPSWFTLYSHNCLLPFLPSSRESHLFIIHSGKQRRARAQIMTRKKRKRKPSRTFSQMKTALPILQK